MKRLGTYLVLVLVVLSLVGPSVLAQGPEIEPPAVETGPISTAAPPGRAVLYAPDNRPGQTTLGGFTLQHHVRALWQSAGPAGDLDTPDAIWPGPDGYGYIGQVIAYDWIEISGSGTPVYLYDNDSDGPFPIGFNFFFYGNNWSHFYIGSNGFISFGDGSNDSSNDCPLPNAADPDYLIALMWDNLDPGDTGDPVYYETFASCPLGIGPCLVVQFDTYHHFPGGTTLAGTFEALIYESGEIIIQFADTGDEQGAESTTGIEGGDAGADHGLTYACNSSSSITDGLSLWFGFPNGIIVQPDPSQQQACPGATVPHELTVRSFTGMTETLTISYSGHTWPVSGPGTLGPIPHGGSVSLSLAVDIPAGTPAGVCDTVDIVVSGDSSAYTTTAVAETCVRLGGQWQDRAAPSFPSMDSLYVEYGGLSYLIGGYGANGAVAIYDPVADIWSSGTGEPSPQISSVMDGCVGLDDVGDPVIVLFPNTTGEVVTLHRYNIVGDSWDTPPVPDPFPVTGLWAMEIVSLIDLTGENVCYLTGGATPAGGGNVNSLYEYHPDTNTIVDLGDYDHHPVGFNFHAAWYAPFVGVDGAICVGGGADANNTTFRDTQCYDLAGDVFNAANADLGQMPIAIWGGADGWVRDGADYQLWLANGADGGANVWQHATYYSALDGMWHYGPDPLYGVYRVEGDNQLGLFYVAGGSSGGVTPTPHHERLMVDCPPAQGTLSGQVLDLVSACADPTCTPAFVRVNPIGMRFPVDPAGHYTATLPAADYAVHSAAAGYAPEGPYTLTVTTGTIAYQDFCLARPEVGVAPLLLQASAAPGVPITLSLAISNTGQAPLDFAIYEAVLSMSQDLVWVWEWPVSGTVAPSDTQWIDVTFMCVLSDASMLTGTLQILHSDPCQEPQAVDLAFHCLLPCDPVTNTDFAWLPPLPLAGETITFTGYAEGSPPISFTWSFGDGFTATGQVTVHSYAAPGVYTVTMMASNCETATAGTVHTVTVLPCDPPHDVNFTWQPLTPTAGQVVSFTAEASGTWPLSFNWNLGDGNAAVGANITHTYVPGGDYTVTMTAANACGQEVVTRVLYICEPVVQAGFAWLPFTPTAGQVVTFSGVAGGTGWIWRIETVDDLGTGGTSLALDAAGLPHISYFVGGPSGSVHYAYNSGAAWFTETVDNVGLMGGYDSLALDAAGHPHISYYNDNIPALRYAYHDGGTWTIETVESGSYYVGTETSLALDTADLPHISYFDGVNRNLKYAYHDGSSWNVGTVDASGNVGRWSSLALDAAGLPHISYSADAPGYELEYAAYDGSAWQIETVAPQGLFSSLALDGAGRPHLCYETGWSPDDVVVYAHNDGMAWITTTVAAGGEPSLALDGAGLPHISYRDGVTGDLAYIYYDGFSWISETVVASGDLWGSDLALDAADRPAILYYDDAIGRLQYARRIHARPTDPIAYAWDLGDGGTALGATIPHTYTLPGAYTVTMTATNFCGQGVVSHVVHVCQPVFAVDFGWSPLTPTVGGVVTFSAVASGSEEIAFRWDLGDGGTAAGAIVSHSYALGGAYTVTLTATNDCGQEVISRVVHVCDPVHAVAFDWLPLTPTVGQVLSFSAVASGTPPLVFDWDLGDGSAASGVTVTHIYTTAGRYTVTLTVRNACGQEVVGYGLEVLVPEWRIYLPLVVRRAVLLP